MTQSAPYENHNTSKPRLGLLVIIGAFVLLTIIVWVGIHFLRPGLSAKGMTGDFMNAVAVPGPEGGHRLWILADSSFQNIQRTESPGRMFVGRKCLSKTNLGFSSTALSRPSFSTE